MLTFEEFTDAFPTNRCCRGSKTAQELYEFITNEETIITMCKYADVHMTPLSGIVEELLMSTNRKNSDFSLVSRKLNRQTVGRMVTEALRELGYEPSTRARVISRNKDNPFSTACTYSNNGRGELYIHSEIRRKN